MNFCFLYLPLLYLKCQFLDHLRGYAWLHFLNLTWVWKLIFFLVNFFDFENETQFLFPCSFEAQYDMMNFVIISGNPKDMLFTVSLSIMICWWPNLFVNYFSICVLLKSTFFVKRNVEFIHWYEWDFFSFANLFERILYNFYVCTKASDNDSIFMFF